MYQFTVVEIITKISEVKKKNLASLIHLKLFFFYGINSRKYLFSFPGQFGSYRFINSYQTVGKHHLLQTQEIGASHVSKWTTLHFLEEGKGLEIVFGSSMKQSIIYLSFYRAFGKFSKMKGVSDHFKGLSLLTLNKSILKVAVIHKICSKVL